MEFFQKNIKKKEIEPKLFALFIRSAQGEETLLYTGVHYTLDEAFGAARERFHQKSMHDEPALDLDSWDILSFNEIYEGFSGKHLETIKIQSVVKDPSQIEKISQIKKEASEKIQNKTMQSTAEIAKEILELKGILMKRLISAGDISAETTMKKIFTKNEIAYLQDAIVKNIREK